jgi:hypothetical protein
VRVEVRVRGLAGCTAGLSIARGKVYPEPDYQHRPSRPEFKERTNLDHVSWHLTETGETVPYLTNDSFPDLGFCTTITFLCGDFLAKDPFRQRTEVGRKEE